MDTWMGINSDPVTLHKYLYANVDPVNMVDPTGNFSMGSFSAGFGGLGRLAGTALNAYSNITTLMQLANGEMSAQELALTFLASKFLPKAFFRCRNSFVGDTLVATEDGLRPIQDIEIGDKIWSYNEETSEKSLQEVIHVVQGEGDKTLVDIELISGEVITATNGHPFYLPESRVWLDAGKLSLDDLLLSGNGSRLKTSAIDSRRENVKVYNLSVANDHTYYVSKSEALVHNCYQKPKWQVYQRGKHHAPKGMSKKKVRESTNNGSAKYYLDNSKDIKNFELNAWKKGVVTRSKPNFKVVEHEGVIGAKYGRDTRWQRLEYDRTSDTIHGHPITREEYLRYLRGN